MVHQTVTIYWYSKRVETGEQAMAGDTKTEEEIEAAKAEEREKRNARIMFIIVITFLCCWTPAFVLYQLLSIWPELPIPSLVISSSWWLAYSNSACNPIIYTVFNKDFREAVVKFLCRC